MADELDLELDTTIDDENNNKVEKRIKDLSGKVKSMSEERDAAIAEAEKAKADAATAQKDMEFLKNFSTVSSKYAGSADYQEQIKEKVNAGYDLEDATVAVLNKEGKFQPVQEVSKPNSPAGGSAVTNFKAGGEKPLTEMSRDEMRAQLIEAEKRGDIGLT